MTAEPQNENKPADIYLLLLAAGSGRRFTSDAKDPSENIPVVPKQYYPIGHKTVLEHSLTAFSGLPVKAAMVTLEKNDSHWPTLNYRPTFKIHTTLGGAERAESVLLGLQALQQQGADDRDWVLVHDAARCCVTAKEIQALIDGCLKQQQGGLLVSPVTDTVKFSGSGEIVERTIPRQYVYLALTPQMFRLGELTRALTQATEVNEVTDEAAAMEAIGESPIMVKGELSNVKLTTFNQLPVIKLILQQQGRL